MEEKLNQALQDHNKFIKATDSRIDAINEKFDQLKDRFDSLNHSLAIIRFLFYAFKKVLIISIVLCILKFFLFLIHFYRNNCAKKQEIINLDKILSKIII